MTRGIVVAGSLAALAAGGGWLVTAQRTHEPAGSRGVTGAPSAMPLPRALGEGQGRGRREGFARAVGPHRFVFPRDHGPHPRYRTEWWYYTGNLRTADGRRFGYELTLFRIALRPRPVRRPSAWATNQIYMAHLALTDVKGRHFYHFQRFSRAALGLAGAAPAPGEAAGGRFRVWLDDWRVEAEPGPPSAACVARGPAERCLNMHLQASARLDNGGGDVRLDLTLRADKPLVLQGDHGLSRKAPAPGDASYYYSFTRLATTGKVSIAGRVFTVRGSSWMDREWSTSALGPSQAGWDWFALQLDDGSDLMFYRLRRKDGRVDPHSAGIWVARDGAASALSAQDVNVAVQAHWVSPHTGVRYPARWRLRVPDRHLVVELRPRLADQELTGAAVRYWEGAVSVTGTRQVDGQAQPVQGVGYVELAGY